MTVSQEESPSLPCKRQPDRAEGGEDVNFLYLFSTHRQKLQQCDCVLAGFMAPDILHDTGNLAVLSDY
jgi:hypothetical protein